MPIETGTGEFDTLLGIEKARRVLGFEPGYSSRNVLPEDER